MRPTPPRRSADRFCAATSRGRRFQARRANEVIAALDGKQRERNDGVWDVWQLEGPGMVWYFRGYPHVHTWVNVQA